MKSSLLYGLIALMVLTTARAVGQEDALFRPVFSVREEVAAFAVDNLDNLYVLNRRDQLKKISNRGDSISVFNNIRKYGKVSSIDVSNPLRVLLFYKDFATIVMLDRLLNVRNTIDLRKQQILRVDAIGQSYDNNIWLFDILDNKLKKIADDGKVLLETPDFRLLFAHPPAPQRIFDQDGLVYLYDSSRGVFVFDYYGALKNTVPITGWEDLKIVGQSILGVSGDTLHRYYLKTFRKEDMILSPPVYPFRQLRFTATRLYALKKEGIDVYNIR